MANRYRRTVRVAVAGLEVDGGHSGSGYGLRIGFTVTRTLKPTPNTAKVTIYNLNATNRAALQELNGTELPVVIEAGYVEEGRFVVFSGDLRHVYSEPQGDGTWATTITSGDGEHAVKRNRTQRTAPAGVSVERLAQDVANDMKVGVGNIVEAIRRNASIDEIGASFATGVNFEGNAMKRLKRIMKAHGLELSIQDGEFLALTPDGTSGFAADVSPGEGGLIGVPVIDKDGRCSFRTLLRPDLKPGSLAQISNSSVANGEWRLESVTSVGDTHSQDFANECEGKVAS